MELRCCHVLEVLDNITDLSIIEECPLSPDQITCAGLEKEHITLAKKHFSTILVQDDPAVHACGNPEADTRGHV